MLTARKSVQITDDPRPTKAVHHRLARAVHLWAVSHSHRHPTWVRHKAFTLVEIMIVVVIIGLLAALAIPAFLKVQQKSRATRFANDFRQFEASFQRFFMEGNSRPPFATGGITPVGMTGYLPVTYNQPSILGGNYWWSGPSGVIVLLGSTADDTLMSKVDLILDDGDLSTGLFQKVGGGYGAFVR